MLSGQSTSVPIDDIIVLREARIRVNLDDKKIAELADSIQRIGLIHFPVICKDMTLVAGERRITACKLLGWTHVPVQFKEDLDEGSLMEIELEENIKRLDLTWQEQVDALKRYHELKVSQQPNWTIAKTAEGVGLAESTVSEYIQVAKAVASGNKLVVAAPKLSVARGIVKRETERRAADMRSTVNEVTDAPAPSHPFITANFLEWALHYSGPKFNLVHCDFPYGINADKFDQGAGASYGGYADDFASYTLLVDLLCGSLSDNFLSKSAHIIFWFSMNHYAYTLERLKSKFWVDPYPLIWHKSDNKGTLPDPERGPRRIYETAFLCSWGDRKIVQARSNVFSGPVQRSGEHMSEKSEDMLAHFLGMLVDEGTSLLDPTCGSGSALRAARRLGCTRSLGIERDEKFYDNAVRAWNA